MFIFWFLVIAAVIVALIFFVGKASGNSSEDMQARIDANLRQELQGSEWELPDGRIATFVDCSNAGRDFVVKTKDGEIVNIKSTSLGRYYAVRDRDNEEPVIRPL